MEWYKFYITYYDGMILERYALVKDKWDLFGIIGWQYAFSIKKIDRIDYEKREPKDDEMNKVMSIPRSNFIRQDFVMERNGGFDEFIKREIH